MKEKTLPILRKKCRGLRVRSPHHLQINNSMYSQAVERASTTNDKKSTKDVWLTFPELKALWSN